MNDKADATGTDRFIIDEAGRVNNSGVLSNNLSYDGAAWRTISPGIGTLVSYAGGAFSLGSNDVATITNPYAVATQRTFTSITNSAGSTSVHLDKSASGKYNIIYADMAGKNRWRMDLGNATAETATDRVGSDFYLYSNNNAGTALFAELSINRATHLATFGGSVACASNFDSVSTTCILSATNGGAIYFRPNGPTSTVEQWNIDTVGNFIAQGSAAAAAGGVYAGRGLRSKGGYLGSYGANWMNLYYSGGFVYVYADATNMGAITWQSDHRIKKNIKKLGSTWEAVKALSPITYSHKKFKDLTEDEDTERWGFLAHELQDKLTKSVAFGNKDEDNVLQSVNPLVLIAALTRALQEAMTRIEALEGAKP
jgi:hypothetical protein